LIKIDIFSFLITDVSTLINKNIQINQMSNDKKGWKSDELKECEIKMQHYWNNNNFNHSVMIKNLNKKFFATFPYPYMNGYLHLGHGFTMSTIDFVCRYKNMLGYNILQPFAFHLTGMPIMAAADKLKHDFRIIDESNGSTINLTENCQYNIMIKMGIPIDDIRNFVEPKYWGEFFSQSAKKTLDRFGYSYDHRRSFITTDANPYYDQFVKWQFHELYHKGSLRFGTRYDIFSVKDSQACLGHERSSGEDAVPLKKYIIPFLINNNDWFVKTYGCENNVYLITITNRPETIYGITNLWIDKNESYEIFKIQKEQNNIDSTEIWICKEYNLINLNHQTRKGDIFHLISYTKIGNIKGNDLISSSSNQFTAINPIDQEEYPIVGLNLQHIDPALIIDQNIGSGILICVPSEYPIDYLGYINADIKNIYKKDVRSIIKITHAEYYGSMMAPDLIDKVKHEKKIKDILEFNTYTVHTKDLLLINDFCSIGSSTSATMICEPYNSVSISEARIKIYNDYSNSIVTYYEPDRETFSRSDDKLIVAKLDQWFIDYSEPSWKIKAHHHVNSMQFNDDSVRNSLHIAVDWLEQWPCSRTYGLGTMFPEEIAGKDTKHMIDSLSDSTIYMAFYTIAHMFKELNIKSEELTYDVFDFIFLLKNYNNNKFSKFIPLRDEFIHWYPVDLRVSAKDLINNHLAMCIFNHVMIWDNDFMDRYKLYYPDSNYLGRTMGPVSYDINGYITVQKPDIKKSNHVIIEKMSKSKGNFKTLDQTISTYSADAVRFTFASASSGTEDAYFDQDLCSRMVDKFHKEKMWISEKLLQLKSAFYVRSEFNLHDHVFLNELNVIIRETLKAYKKLDFRNVITFGFHILQGLRDTYHNMTCDDMNPNIIKLFIKTQLTLMYPIIPHFCDYYNICPIYNEVFNPIMTNTARKMFLISDISDIFNKDIDQELRWMHKYLSDLGSNITKRVLCLNKKHRVQCVSIFVAGSITDPFEQLAYNIYRHRINSLESYSMSSNEIINSAKNLESELVLNGNNINMIIRYYKHIEELIVDYGIGWLEKRLLNNISEKNIIDDNLKYYLKQNNTNNYLIKVIVYDPLIHKDKVSGCVRINNPIIKYDT
jgi:leucyl-tRNA synthetase